MLGKDNTRVSRDFYNSLNEEIFIVRTDYEIAFINTAFSFCIPKKYLHTKVTSLLDEKSRNELKNTVEDLSGETFSGIELQFIEPSAPVKRLFKIFRLPHSGNLLFKAEKSEKNNPPYIPAELNAGNQNRMLRSLMKTIAGMAYRCRYTSNREIDFISEGSMKLTGYTSGELYSAGKTGLGSLIHPSDRERVWREIRESCLSNHYFELEYRLLSKNGETIWVSDRGLCIDIPGKNKCIEGIISDISDYKRIQQQLTEKNRVLERAREKAEESDRLKTAFLANVSHEIRTPMNGILGFINLLKLPGLSTGKQDRYLELIGNSAERMLNTLNDIIDISRIETGEISLTISPLNVAEFIKEMADLHRPGIDAKGLTFTVARQEEDHEMMVSTDHYKLSTIISNLLKNAIKFTPSGGIHLGYKLNEGYVQFFVKDTGIGIAPERSLQIFDRFCHTDDSFLNDFEGAGLGLSICKAYTELLGGKIWFVSEKNSGSTFYVNHPLNTNLPEISRLNLKPGRKKPPNPLENFTILLAEDDITSMIYLKKMLEGNCQKVYEAGNGMQAIKMVRDNNDINLVLMDLRMPGTDGFTAVRRIRAMDKSLIIIAQTAYSTDYYRDIAMKAGFDGFVSKPLNLKTLIGEMNFILSKKEIT